MNGNHCVHRSDSSESDTNAYSSTEGFAKHRMLSTYVNTLARNGLIIEEIAEQQPPPGWIAVAPSVGPAPVYLAARCRKE